MFSVWPGLLHTISMFQADKSRPLAPTLKQDLLAMYKSSSCCDMVITCCEKVESQCILLHDADTSHKEFKVHRALVAARWPYLHEVIKGQVSEFVVSLSRKDCFKFIKMKV